MTGSPGRRPDELAHAGRENLDPAHAARYDDKEDASAGAEVALLGDLGVAPGDHLVDLGAGTGQLTVAAARAGLRVTAVDVSPVMLAVLRDKVRRDGLAVDVVQAGFLSYVHVGDAADVVYSRYALHHLPDLWKAVALARVRAMLRPGGLLRLWDVVFSWEPAAIEERAAAWCAELPETAPAGRWRRADLEDHLREEHSTLTWLLEPMIERAGFRIEDVEHLRGTDARYVARAV